METTVEGTAVPIDIDETTTPGFGALKVVLSAVQVNYGVRLQLALLNSF